LLKTKGLVLNFNGVANFSNKSELVLRLRHILGRQFVEQEHEVAADILLTCIFVRPLERLLVEL